MSDPQVTEEELRNAEDARIREIREQTELSARAVEEILAVLDVESSRARISDQRSLMNRYPSNSLFRNSIFQTSPGNASRYEEVAGENIVSGQGTVNPENQFGFAQDGLDSQFVANSAEMDPIRLWFKLGEDIGPDPSNFYRSTALGVDSNTNRRWTYEPAGSVNIIWNLPGNRRVSENGQRTRRWSKTNDSPTEQEYDDSALQWSLAVNHVGGQNDQPVYALTEPYKAWDVNDPNKKPLRKQLVFKNRLPQAQQGNGETIFNMASAMIRLASFSTPVGQTPQGSSESVMIEALKSERNGLYPGRQGSLRRMMTIAGIIGNDRAYEKEFNFSNIVTSFGRSSPILDDEVVDFNIPDYDEDEDGRNRTARQRRNAIRSRLGRVFCNSYQVYEFCRRLITGEDPNLGRSAFRLNFGENNQERATRLNELEELVQSLYGGERDERLANQRGANNFVDYEFYDFKNESVWSRDRFTDMIDLAPGRFQSPSTRTRENQVRAGRVVSNEDMGALLDRGGAYVNPEYSYYDGQYEFASFFMPEALLPNMYIYNLATGNQNDIPVAGSNPANFLRFRGSDGRESQNVTSDEERRLGRPSRLYDKLITLDQFENFTLPLLGGGDLEADERQSFQEYLRDYAEAVKGSNVTIDFTSQLNQKYVNQATPPDELDMYDNFYRLRTYFPMYIEVGIPCYSPLGDIGQAMLSLDNPETEETDFDVGFTSTGMINSFLSSPSTDRNFTIRSSGLVASGFDPNENFSVNRDRDRTTRAENFIPRVVKTTAHNIGMKVYDFDTWIENMGDLESSQISNISFRGPNNQRLNPVRSGELENIIDSIKQTANRLCAESMVKYQDLTITKEKLVADSETIFYKLIKKDFESGDVLQNYFFPNSSVARMIKFVDTQIKYGKRYLYELHAFDVVYGSTFRFRNRWAAYPGPSQSNEWNPDQEGALDSYSDERISFSFNVETLPNLKVIEYPIYTFGNTLSLAAAAGLNSFSEYFVQLQAGQLGGVSYPIAGVYDRPPLAPEVSIFPFQGEKNKILFNLREQVGELTADNSIKYIPLMPEDNAKYKRLEDNQRQLENFTLPPGHLEFKTEGFEEIRMAEIFRTTNLDMRASSREDLYRSFEGRLYKTLDITLPPDDPSGNYARSLDFMDEIDSNKDYYYTVRFGDMHGNLSNPSEIYRVRIDSQEDGSYPVIEAVNFKKQNIKAPAKEMVRYLEIQAADIQSIPYVAAAEGDITTSLKSLVDYDTENKVENNKFLIRITSKDTGRKIDIKTSFALKE
jgi:hypothetical protein